MAKHLLEIKNLHVSVEGKEILHGIDLVINEGESHIMMGANGKGKSTLVNVIMGDPRYNITEGQIFFKGEDITHISADKRAKKGIFLSFQSPEEVMGVGFSDFIRYAIESKTGKPPKLFKFYKELREKMELLDMDKSYQNRYLNVGFSGGEKKKGEILQLLMLNPQLAMLDETDSGLDVDAIKSVTTGINAYHNESNSLLVITHNPRLLDNLPVDYVHILDEGKIEHSGGRELADEIARNGFHIFEEEV